MLWRPTPTPYDPLAWQRLPFAERGRQVCEAWALQGYGAPLAVYALYALKLVGYVAGWSAFCSFTPGLGGLRALPQWWLSPIAFEKAILWSMLFEGVGLGCGSGPLTGRYVPPLGGALYFWRPGTIKLPLFPSLPLLGGTRRTLLDVAVHLALVAALLLALLSPQPTPAQLGAIFGLALAVGVLDRTAFLALRPEHYVTTIACFLFAQNWIAGAKSVQLALWFFAGFSKLNHHFPTVVGVMVSNSPLTPFPWLRKRMYRDYPRDLRPSTLATWMGHAGTLLELSLPLVLLFATGGTALVVGMVMMLALHAFITSNVPMGVPLEWNAMVVYGAFALFWAHPGVHAWDVRPLWLAAALAIVLIGVPLAGNLAPARVSFLLAMRYYAGNWAYSIWLFRGDARKKLEKLTATSPWVHDQLERFYDPATAVGIVGKVVGFRLMHLHGRALPRLIPRAVSRLEDYEYVDGEIIGGLALGWNFGDGHLHREPLLRAIQAQCGFEPGELRCIFVEGQPLGRSSLGFRIVDAASGLVEQGELPIAELRAVQPWSA